MGKWLFAWALWYWLMDHITLKAEGVQRISVYLGNIDFKVNHKGKFILHRACVCLACKPNNNLRTGQVKKGSLLSISRTSPFVCLLVTEIKKSLNQSAMTLKAREQYLLLLFDYVKGLAMTVLNRIFSVSTLNPSADFSSYKVLISTSWCQSTISEVLWNIILFLYFWILQICWECWKQV